MSVPLEPHPEAPKVTELRERDVQIFQAIYAYEGLMSLPQIQRRFFNSRLRAQRRMSQLWQNGYVARPAHKYRMSLDDMIYWLDERGAKEVAARQEVSVRALRWVKPGTRGSLINHDLKLNDFRLTVEAAFERPAVAELLLEMWIPSIEFWADFDTIYYRTANGVKRKRQMKPDGYFSVLSGTARSRFLVELDNTTEDNPSFGRYKVLPAITYLKSQAFERRFGANSGRWLIVAQSQRRMRNLKQQTEMVAGEWNKYFYFAVASDIRAETVLTAPIWYPAGQEVPVALFNLK